MTIWYILYSFGTFFPGLLSCSLKNLATLIQIRFFAPKCRYQNLRMCQAFNFIPGYKTTYIHGQRPVFNFGEIWPPGVKLAPRGELMFDLVFFFLRGCPGWGANPGPLDFVYFLIYVRPRVSQVICTCVVPPMKN
jgi:hypothetical protein